MGVHVNWYKVRSEKWADSKQPTFQPRVTVKQLDHQAVELFGQTFGGHHYVDTTNVRGSKRPINTWAVHSRAAGGVIRQLRPFLRIKTSQADLLLELCDLNASPRRHTYVVPPVVPDEILIPLADAAGLAGKTYAVAHQSVRLNNIPFVRTGGRVFVPESFIPEWASRPPRARRRPEISDRMEEIALEIKALNSGKRGLPFVAVRRTA